MEDFKNDDLVVLTLKNSGSVWQIEGNKMSWKVGANYGEYYKCICLESKKTDYHVGGSCCWSTGNLKLIPNFKVGDDVIHMENGRGVVWHLLAKKDLYWAAERFNGGIRCVEVFSVFDIEPCDPQIKEIALSSTKLDLNLSGHQKKVLAAWIKEGNLFYTHKPVENKLSCTCSIQDLMAGGCKCGQMKREKE